MIMIKVTDKYHIKKDLHGWSLLEEVVGHRKETKEPYTKFNSTFHANLTQVCAKLLHECSDVSGDLSDLKSAWFYCLNEMTKVLEDKVDAN
jgi:hypothetical protein